MAEQDAEEILKKTGRSRSGNRYETLRLPADKVVRIQNLANQCEGIVQKLEAAHREQVRLATSPENQAEDRLATMAKPVDTDPLKNLIQRVQHEGDLEAPGQSIA